VLGTLVGFGGKESTQTSFHWPQSSRGEQGREAATNALEAFVRGQVERAGVRVIVLFGETLRQLLLPDVEAGDQRVEFLDAQCVLTGSTEQLRNSAERKRSLWQCILTIPEPS
jgi:predicted ATP-grasp superfamily ATP-dependent carboligase